MLGGLRRALVGVGGVVLALAPAAQTATAAGIQCPTGWVGNTGYAACTLIGSYGDPGGGGSGGGSGGGGGGEPVCMYGQRPIPCVTDEGYWVADRQCWINKMNPQPGPEDPAWGDKYPDGAIYQCWHPGGWPQNVWFADPPPPTEGAVPMDLLGQVIARMGLRGIDMGSTPPMIDGRVGLIGFPVWLWAKNPDAHTWGPISASVSAAGYSMRATAKASRVEWEMGNGDVVPCNNPGTAWGPRDGRSESPTCGYQYLEDGYYDVQSATFWEVQWQGLGQSGTVPLALFSRGRLAVAELQVLVQPSR